MRPLSQETPGRVDHEKAPVPGEAQGVDLRLRDGAAAERLDGINVDTAQDHQS
jgi:hypothetical protein